MGRDGGRWISAAHVQVSLGIRFIINDGFPMFCPSSHAPVIECFDVGGTGLSHQIFKRTDKSQMCHSNRLD